MMTPMPQHRAIRTGSVIRWILVYGGYGPGTLMLVALIVIWYRGLIQESRVASLLAVAENASIQAQYDAYQYEPPLGLRKPAAPGTLSLILGGGQRNIGFDVRGDPPEYLAWLVPILGGHGFARVTDIRVNDERFSDADVDLLLAFPDLRAIDVSDTAITDVGLARLASLEQLVELNISRTKVSPSALRRLTHCRNLKELDISDTDADEQLAAELQQALPDCWIRQSPH